MRSFALTDLQDTTQGQGRRRLQQTAPAADVHLQIQAADAAHAVAANQALQAAVNSGALAVWDAVRMHVQAYTRSLHTFLARYLAGS